MGQTNNVFEAISRGKLREDLISQSIGKLKYMLELSICFLLWKGIMDICQTIEHCE